MNSSSRLNLGLLSDNDFVPEPRIWAEEKFFCHVELTMRDYFANS